MFKKKFNEGLIQVLVMALTGLLKPQFIAKVKELVIHYMDHELRGLEKKERVMADLTTVGGHISQVIADSASLLISITIDVIVLSVKLKMGKVEV